MLGGLVCRCFKKGVWCRCFCAGQGNGKCGINSSAFFFFLTTAEAANLPPLTEAQKNKLRHLSVVTLAAKIKVVVLFSPRFSFRWDYLMLVTVVVPQCIPYSMLLEQLQLKNVRQLEDLVIEAVYADVLRGSLDQRNQRLEVDYSIGRDIRREELSTITRTLQEW